MYSLILHGGRRRSSLVLQKWRTSTTLAKLLVNQSSFSTSSSSSLAPDSSSSSTNRREGKAFTISYLVESLGLTTKLAESISKKVTFNENTNPDSVLNLLKSHGFADSQISNIVTIHPNLLTSDPEKSIAPKLNLLLSRGASISELTEIVSKVPEILAKERSISVYYDFIKEVIEGDKVSVSLPPQGSRQENKIKNLIVLRNLGMPNQLLFHLLISNCPYVCGKEKFDESLKKLLRFGFDPTSLRFVEALRIFQGLKSETIDLKIDVYKRLGFVEEEIWFIFKKYPIFLQLSEKKITKNFETMKMCGLLEEEVRLIVKKFPQCIGVSDKNILNSVETFLGLGFSKEDFAGMVKRLPAIIGYSVETVKKKIEFVVDQMKWPMKSVVSYPNVLGYSMENRTLPRCNVIKALLAKGLLGRELPSMSSVLVCTDHEFLKRYVLGKRCDEKLVTELMAIFTRR